MNLEFSIIIPYWNKLYEINLMLKAFLMQDYDLNKFEIVIINDGCNDKITEIIDKYKNSLNINYHYIEHTGNRGANRNLGAKIAKAQRLIFLDSDMIPAKNIIKNFDLETKDKLKVSLGTRYALLDMDKNYIDENTLENNFEIFENLPAWNDDRTMGINFGKRSGINWVGNWQFLYSHCFCIWKETFEKVKGFDEEFSKNWGAEDVELGYRLCKNLGCKIELNERVRCYHIFHGASHLKTTESLKKNYEIFSKKYEDWNVELFIREFECWAMEAIIIQNKILNRKHLVTDLENIDELIKKLPDKTLLAGIDIKVLIDCEKVEAVFNPESLIESPKIKNIMGIRNNYGENHFKLAVISGEYENVNPGLGIFLEDCLSKIAERVITVKNGDKNITDKLNNASKQILKNKKYVIFTLGNDANHNLNRHSFLNLAIAADTIGINTSVELSYDPLNEIDINKGYMYFADKTKIDILNKLKSRIYNFIGDMIPCIIESECAADSNRALGQRIFWEDIVYQNQEKYFELQSLKTYSKILVKRDWEKNKLANINLDKYLLPIGIDKNKIEKIKNENPEKESVFTFLWAEQFTAPHFNLRLVLDAFKETFGSDKNVQLKIISPENYRKHYRSEYYGKTLDLMLNNITMQLKHSMDMEIKELKEIYGEFNNIKFIACDGNEEFYAKELYKADCLVSVSSRTEVHPLVLESIAFGKKPVIVNDNRYEGYFTDDLCYKVNCEKTFSFFDFDRVENAHFADMDRNKYFLMNQPDKASLCNVLLKAYNDRADKIDRSTAKEFIEKFNWLVIAEKLNDILFRYYQ